LGEVSYLVDLLRGGHEARKCYQGGRFKTRDKGDWVQGLRLAHLRDKKETRRIRLTMGELGPRNVRVSRRRQISSGGHSEKKREEKALLLATQRGLMQMNGRVEGNSILTRNLEKVGRKAKGKRFVPKREGADQDNQWGGSMSAAIGPKDLGR